MKAGRPNALPDSPWRWLLLPLMLLAVLVTAPFALAAQAVQERLRRCPNCGRRGTLEHVRKPEDRAHETLGRPGVRLRVNPERAALRCAHCGFEYREVEGRLLPV